MPKEEKKKTHKKYRWLRRSLRVLAVCVLLLILTVVGIMVAIQTPYVQNKVSDWAIEQLNNEFDAKLSVDSVDIDFFGDINLYNVESIDNQNEKFISIPRIKVSSTLWSISGLQTLYNSQENITLDYVKLYNPNIKVITYKGETESNFIRFIEAFDDGESSGESNFKLDGNIDIENGTLLIQNMNLPENEQIWLDSKSFNGSIRDFKYYKNRITANLKSLNFEATKNGEKYQLKNLSTDFEYADNLMSFDNLDFETNDSRLLGSLTFKYDNIKDFSEFNDKVKWDLKLEDGSKVHFKDIRYWTDGFTKNNSVNIAASVTGTLNDLNISNLDFDGENVQVKAKSLNLFKVTNAEQLTIDAQNLSAKASYNDLTNLLPTEYAQDIDPYVKRFGIMEYIGDFNYDRNQITANGIAKTQLGNAKVNGKITNYKDSENITYQGYVETDNFDLKGLTNAEELGSVAGRINFDGKGTDVNNLIVSADGNVGYIDILGKRYSGIELDGIYHHENFKGIAKINNSNLKLTYDGEFDFSKKPYYFKFNSDIQRLDLDYLGLTTNRSVIKGIASGEIYYSSVDDFTGNVHLNQADYSNRSNSYSIDEAFVEANKFENAQQLLVDIPKYLNAEINGEFVLSELPDAILNSFQDLIIDYEPKKLSKNQHFDFDINIQQDIINHFYPDIKIQPNTTVSGVIDTNTNHVITYLNTPGLNYSGLDFAKTNVDINSLRKENPVLIHSDSILIENFALKDVKINATPNGDELKINTSFYTGNKSPIIYKLNFAQRINAENKFELGLDPSTITINNNDWMINEESDFYSNRVILDFENNQYLVDNIEITNSGQKLFLDGYYNSKDDYFLNADIQDLFLSNVIPQEFLGDLKLEGVANGDLKLEKNTESLKPTVDLDISDIVFNNYEIGDFSLEGEYNTLEERAYIDGQLNKGQQQTLLLVGHIDNSTEEPTLDIDANFDEFSLKFLGGFLSGVMSNFRGDASGNIHFQGNVVNPTYVGNLSVQNVGFKIDFLNTDYQFDNNNNILLSKQETGPGSILLNAIDFKDTKFNTEGIVTGYLLFEQLTEWYLNLAFESDNLLVLNTTEFNNELFYGRVFANGAFSVSGTTEDLKFETEDTIDPITKERVGFVKVQNSDLTINTGSYFVDTETSLVRFVPNQQIIDETTVSSGATGFTMDFKVKADESSIVKLIFDSATNDQIWARGNSENLHIKMNKNGDLTMDGYYEVENGVYEFRRLPTPKDFVIQKGGFIQWTNSPYDADLNITATYLKVVSNIGEYIGTGTSQAENVNLNIKLTKTLEQPEIEFDIQVPGAQSDVKTQLESRLRSSPEEEFSQFGFILLTGQFGVNDTRLFASGDAIAKSAAADIALRQFSNLISSIAKEVQIDFNYVTGSTTGETADKINARVNLLIDPRWTLKGTGGVPLSTVYNESLTLEVEAEYDASKNNDGSILIKGFSKPTTFGVENFSSSSSATQSYGVGITLTRSANRFGDLFKSQKRRQREEKERRELQKRIHEERKKRDSANIEPTIENITDSINIKENQVQVDSIETEDKTISKKEKFNRKQSTFRFK